MRGVGKVISPLVIACDLAAAISATWQSSAMSRHPLAWRRDQIELPRPREERFHGLLLLGAVPRALKSVEHFVATVDAWSRFMLTHEHQRICK